jgi:hypothetical protein
MAKNNNSTLLARIDERTAYIQRDVKDLNRKQGKIFDKLDEHNTRIAIIEAEHKKSWHSGFYGLLMKLILGK